MTDKLKIPRILAQALHSRKKSVLLVGPRQTGKSSLIRSMNPDLEINLAQEKTYHEFQVAPDRLEQILAAHPLAKKIFIDEIQRIPPMLNTIQHLIDHDASLQFFLTGSSARKLKRGKANLLPGRIVMERLGGLCAKELNYQMNTKDALSVGTLPEPYLHAHESETRALLDTYSSVYLREEIQMEALVENISGFSRFLAELVNWNSQILDFSKLAKKTKNPRTSVVRFFEILEDTLIGTRVKSEQSLGDFDVIKHPRFYFFDVGVLNGMLRNFIPSSDRVGALFETLFYNQLIHSAQALRKSIEVTFFRTRNGFEVDFVVRLEQDVYLIEVKVGDPSSSEVESVARLHLESKTKIKKSFVAVMDQVLSRRVGNVTVAHWQQVLKEMGL